MVHFHLSLSGCGMGSLETCTHVILMPESHIVTTKISLSKCYPPPWKNRDENVVISGMHKWKGDENVVISGMYKWKGDKNIVSSGMQKLECHKNVEISLGMPLRRWWVAYQGDTEVKFCHKKHKTTSWN